MGMSHGYGTPDDDESRRVLARALELGAFFSLNGHEARSPKVLQLIPLDRVLTETDFPFSQRYDRSADRPSAVDPIEAQLAQHHHVPHAEHCPRPWTTPAPLTDLPAGASSIDSITHEGAPTVRTHGKTTLVLSRVTIVGRYSGREVSHEFRSLHVWINEKGGWRLAFNQLTPVE